MNSHCRPADIASPPRRAFLGGAVAVFLAGIPGGAGASVDLIVHLGPAARTAAIVIGAAVRRAELCEDGVHALARRLEKDLDLAVAPDPVAARAALRRRIRLDFETGAVVDVDGWRLSETEARFSALVHAASKGWAET